MPPQPEEQGRGNFLTAKFHGIPAWTILVVVLALAFIYFKIKSNKQASTQATTTPGTPSGTSAGLTSTLVGVQQPTPILDGTYQVSISPENQPSSVYSATTLQPASTTAGGLAGTDTTMANANSTAAVTPQTQPSSPQTQNGSVG
jgi:hypothetical protein